MNILRYIIMTIVFFYFPLKVYSTDIFELYEKVKEDVNFAKEHPQDYFNHYFQI